MDLSSDDYKNIIEIIEVAYSIPDRNAMLQAVFERLAKMLRLSSAVLVPSDSRTGQFQVQQNFLFNGHSKEFLQYVNYYAALDPLATVQILSPHLARALRYGSLLEEQRHSTEIGVIVMCVDGQILYIDEEAANALCGRSPETISDPGSCANPVFFRTETGMYRVRTIPVKLWNPLAGKGAIVTGDPTPVANSVVDPYGSAKIILLEPLPSRWDILQKLSCYGLSSRQNEIAIWFIRGFSNREIDERLFIAEQTVKDHLHDIFGKMEVKRRSELIAKVLEI